METNSSNHRPKDNKRSHPESSSLQRVQIRKPNGRLPKKKGKK